MTLNDNDPGDIGEIIFNVKTSNKTFLIDNKFEYMEDVKELIFKNHKIVINPDFPIEIKCGIERRVNH